MRRLARALARKSWLLLLSFGYMFFVCWMVLRIQDVSLHPFRVQVDNGLANEVDTREERDELVVEKLDVDETCLTWCHRGAQTEPPYFLTAVLLVRIYVSDLARLSTRELSQWLYYLRFAGFEHVYIYDAYHYKNESQQKALEPWISDGYVTYLDWSHRAKPYSIEGTQHSAYQDCIDRWGNMTTWQSSIDIDEYPFCPNDTESNFMKRFIETFSAQNAGLSQLTMQNYLFLGKPLNDSKHPLLIDRIWRRTKEPANNLVKPIYKPKHVSDAAVHHHNLWHGKSADVPDDIIRLNHYWGARLQNWGEDTPEILAKTERDNSMKPIIKSLQKCDVCLPNTDFVYRVQWN